MVKFMNFRWYSNGYFLVYFICDRLKKAISSFIEKKFNLKISAFVVVVAASLKFHIPSRKTFSKVFSTWLFHEKCNSVNFFSNFKHAVSFTRYLGSRCNEWGCKLYWSDFDLSRIHIRKRRIRSILFLIYLILKDLIKEFTNRKRFTKRKL